MDERAHIPASYSYVKYLDMRINPEHPPLIKDFSGLAILLSIPRLNFPVPSILWDRGDENVKPEDHPEGPARTWALAQWEFGNRFLFKGKNNSDTIVFSARLPITIIAILLGLAIFLWTRQLAGTLAGLFALLLYTCDPNIIGHNHLVTTDISIAAFTFFSFYFFIRFLKNPSIKNSLFFGLFLGLVQLTKFSAVILFPFFGIITVLFAISLLYQNKENDREHHFKRTDFIHLFAKFFGAIIICFVIILSTYTINTWNMSTETIQEIARTHCANDTATGQLCEAVVINMSSIPALKPLSHYFLGVFMVFDRVKSGSTYYFLGTVSNDASPLYFPTVFFMKETLPLIILILFGIVSGLWHLQKIIYKKHSSTRSLTFARSFSAHITEYTLTSYIMLYSCLSITGNLNIGFRHLFPILPLIIVLTSKVAFDFWTHYHTNKPTHFMEYICISLYIIWIILIPVFAFPHSYLSYFNTLVGGSSQGYHYATDSNYDWGQDVKRLRTWIHTYNNCIKNHQSSTSNCQKITNNKDFPTSTPIEKIRFDHFGGSDPEYYLKPFFMAWNDHRTPEAGWYAISAMFYQESIHKNRTESSINYSWIPKESMVGRAGDSIFIFYIDTVTSN